MLTPTRRVLLVTAATVLIASGATAALVLGNASPEPTGGASPAASTAAAVVTTPTAQPVGTTDPQVTGEPSTLAPPTESPTETAAPEPGAAPGVVTTTVPIVVTIHGSVAGGAEAAGYVEGVVESGGTCALVLTQGGLVVTEEVEAIPDATATSCGLIQIPGERLARGTWEAVLTYRSEHSTGSSSPFDVEVR